MDFYPGQDYYQYQDGERIQFQIAYSGISISFTFFVIVHNVFHLLRSPPPHIKTRPNFSAGLTDTCSCLKKYRNDSDYWKWKNLNISWLHAAILSLWILASVVFYPEFLEDLILHHNMSSYLMVCFATGYFLYDFADMWRLNLLKDLWEITLHHVAITSLMIWNLYDCQRIAWCIIALSTEINTVFLHSRKLLRISRVGENSPLYRIVMYANLASFVIFRFGGMLLILVGTVIQNRRFTLAYWVCLIAMQVVMNVINPVLFYRLIKSDFLKPQIKQKLNSNAINGNFHHVNGCQSKVKRHTMGCPDTNGRYVTHTNEVVKIYEKTH